MPVRSVRLALVMLLAAGVGESTFVGVRTVRAEERETAPTPERGDEPLARADLSRVARGIVKDVNEFRRQQGRGPLAVDQRLAETARRFADYMARTGEYGHQADGRRPADRAKKQGYDFCIVSENIAYQYSSVGFTAAQLGRNFFKGWKRSPGHRRNMLDPDVVETGVAVARSEETGAYYAVQMLGRPKDRAIEFTVENRADVALDYQIDDRQYDLPPRLIRTHRNCRPSEVTFRWPEAEERVATPGSGDRLVIVREDGALRLTTR